MSTYKDKDTLFQVNITHSLKKHVNTIMILLLVYQYMVFLQ